MVYRYSEVASHRKIIGTLIRPVYKFGIFAPFADYLGDMKILVWLRGNDARVLCVPILGEVEDNIPRKCLSSRHFDIPILMQDLGNNLPFCYACSS